MVSGGSRLLADRFAAAAVWLHLGKTLITVARLLRRCRDIEKMKIRGAVKLVEVDTKYSGAHMTRLIAISSSHWNALR